MPDKLIGKAEAAEMLGISQSTLDRIVADGNLPLYRIRGRCRYDTADIGDYLRRCREHRRPPDKLPRAKAPAPRKGQLWPAKYVPGMKVV